MNCICNPEDKNLWDFLLMDDSICAIVQNENLKSSKKEKSIYK